MAEGDGVGGGARRAETDASDRGDAGRTGEAGQGEPDRFGAERTRHWISVPQAGDDKYSRGVLGMVTGSDRFPGAAVLGVEGAARTGTGMIRYLGPRRAADFVLQRRPEVVTADGRVQAWLIGSGMPADRDDALASRLRDYLGQGAPVVLDAGALDLVGDAVGPVLLTPHYGELATLLGGHDLQVDKATIAREPARWAARAAETVGATVLLKGSTTFVADPSGLRHTVTAGPPWVATAGAGDVLGGVLGALLATHERELRADPHVLADLAAAGAWLHGEAGRSASRGAAIAALDIAEAIPDVLRSLLGSS